VTQVLATEAPAATEAASTETAAAGGEECGTPTPVKLQLQWVTQAQFAGYFAAVDQGFYADQCLDVTILEGAVDIVPQTVLANGDADFAIAWVPKALASREAGANIVDIAQVFQRSGTLQVSFKEKNITKPKDFIGKKIGNWGFGNEWEVFAAMSKYNVEPTSSRTWPNSRHGRPARRRHRRCTGDDLQQHAQALEATNPRPEGLHARTST
jgi:NitT/TauT family transport system substrate-binding protein